MAIVNRLEQFELEEMESIQREGFKIEDKTQAQWALRKIKALKSKVSETEELANMEIERIKAWQEKETKSDLDSIEYFEGLLLQYMMKEREVDPKVKTIKLPSGKLKFKKQQPEYVRDEKELIQWAKENEKFELLKVKESFDWATLKKNIAVSDGKAIDSETGEVIEAITVVDREDKFEVEVD